MENFRRREVLAGVALAGGLPARSFAANAPTTQQMLARSEFLIQNAYIMTMDAALGDIAGGAIHVKDGAIVAVGSNVSAPGVPVFDGTDMIVVPGLVDTHWHMWNTLFRSFSGDQADQSYFPTVAKFGAVMTPEDSACGTSLAAAEAINSGTTTVHNYCHNVRSREHAEADIRATLNAGLRGRWSCGWPQGIPDTEITDLSILSGLKRDWANFSGGGMLSLGLGWRGQYRASKLPENVYRPEFEKARELKLPISVHVGTAHSAVGQISDLIKSGFVGPDVQLIHGLAITPDEIRMIKESGSVFSLAPAAEMRMGHGIPPVNQILAAGIPLGISVDSLAVVGAANMFAILKLVCAIGNATAYSEFNLTPRRALQLGTIDSARSLGLDAVTGSLKPGKRADLVMISTSALNMAVFTDPAHMVIECTQPENVDTVVVDGRVLKRNGKLTAIDSTTVVQQARMALKGIRDRAKWR